MSLPAARRLLTAHPASIGESYAEHLGHATGAGMRLIVAGIACLIHALLPFLFVDTASRTINRLHEGLAARRAALSVPSSPRRSARPGSAEARRA
jgi:hypothetical protein